MITELLANTGFNRGFDQKGRLFVLIGRGTFSSAVLNTEEFRGRTRAIVMGEPSGGAINAYGEVSQFTLPNSKLVVGCSTRAFGNPSPGMTQGIVPDIQIEESFADYARGIDDVYEAVKNYRS